MVPQRGVIDMTSLNWGALVALAENILDEYVFV